MAPRKIKENNEEKVTRVLRPKLVPNELQAAPSKSPVKALKEDNKKKRQPAKPKADAPKVAPKPKKVAAKGHKLPDPIKQGEIFIDSAKKSWKVGKSLGSGGFGEVYSATNDLDEKNIDAYKYVMKVEHSTGPLFVEQHFYIRCAKSEQLEAWKKAKKVKSIGLPTFHAMKGQKEHNGSTYRFIIITKFGQDLQKLLDTHKIFSLKNTANIAFSLLDTLEYIHHCGYVHADLKPANILLGTESSHAIVNIVDFGLATKYIDTDDNPKSLVVEKKNAHNGTLIYTSVVAHRGAITTSRMCDIEILGYNLLHMNTGSLPWSSLEKQPQKVLEMKEELLKDPAKFFIAHYKEPVSDVFVDLFKYIAACKFDDSPDYNHIKKMFAKSLQKSGLKIDGKLNFDEKNVETASSNSNKQVKQKRNVKKKIVENDETELPIHIDESALKFVNTKKRAHAKLDVIEEVGDDSSSDREEEEEVVKKVKDVKEKKRKNNPKESKAETAKSVEVAHNLNETYVKNDLNETYNVPTPAMLEVLAKRKEKKTLVKTQKKK